MASEGAARREMAQDGRRPALDSADATQQGYLEGRRRVRASQGASVAQPAVSPTLDACRRLFGQANDYETASTCTETAPFTDSSETRRFRRQIALAATPS